LSRRRFWKSENDGDKFAAYSTLYTVLVDFSKILAPILPFITDFIYTRLTKTIQVQNPHSVHLCDFPVANKNLQNRELEEKMDLVRKAVELGRSLRSVHQLKTRQPLKSVSVVVKNEKQQKYFEELSDLIRSELNVKTVVVSSNEETFVNRSAKPNLKLLGKVLGKQMKEATEIIKAFGNKEVGLLETGATIEVLGQILTLEHILIERIPKEGFVVESDAGITVALDTELDKELEKEGLARELVNRIQNLRKDAGFEVSDHIKVGLKGDDLVYQSVVAYGEYVKNETLANEIQTANVLEKSDISNEFDIDGILVTISIKRV
jgi:isoleucyl-tRNA synthetase